MQWQIKHASLFTGIGGFDLAAKWRGYTNVFQCEKNEWCQKLLKKNFPECELYEDVKTFDARKYEGKITILTGGFPCQPFSLAGKRRGKEDDRYLWPEMLRIIREVKPQIVIGENVPGIINMALDTVLSDLESEGYKTEAFIIPACAVNAPHRRDRVWIIAYSNSKCFKKPYKGHRFQEKGTEEALRRCIYAANWAEKWTDVASKLCRVDDGFPTRLDKNRIAALGNAIVPQVAFEIFGLVENLIAYETEVY